MGFLGSSVGQDATAGPNQRLRHLKEKLMQMKALRLNRALLWAALILGLFECGCFWGGPWRGRGYDHDHGDYHGGDYYHGGPP